MKQKSWLSYARASMGITHGIRAFGGPPLATLSLTNRCNIRCIHCFFYSPNLEDKNLLLQRKENQQKDESVGDEYLSRLQRLDAQSERTGVLLDELVSMGTRRFVFTGSGEPFLHQNALEFMNRISHAGCSFAVNTNCTILDRETIDELVRMGPSELRINALAGSKETYLRTHPGVAHETFDKLKNNLLCLADRKKALRVRYPEVTLFCVVVSQNHDGLMEFAEFASLVEADRVHIDLSMTLATKDLQPR